MLRHPGFTMMRGYKVYSAWLNGAIMGAKFCPHVLLQNCSTGNLLDPTEESDDRSPKTSGEFKYMFVPYSELHMELSDSDILGGACMRETRVFGTELYMKVVTMNDKLCLI